MSKRQMQEGHEGEENNRVAPDWRPARKFVSLVPALSSSRTSSNTNPVSLGRPEERCQSSHVVNTERLGATKLSTDDVRISQEQQREWNEQIGTGDPKQERQ